MAVDYMNAPNACFVSLSSLPHCNPLQARDRIHIYHIIYEEPTPTAITTTIHPDLKLSLEDLQGKKAEAT